MVLNGVTELLSRIVFLAVQFIIRSIFIAKIGEELLGLDGTILSILNVFSLLESGLSSALIVYLVKPIESNDYPQINKILNTYRVLYKIIGMVYLVLALIFTPFLKGIIRGITSGSELYVYYLILAANGGASYFLSYRRVLLYADQKMYVQSLVDISFNIIFGVIQGIFLYVASSYLVYVILKTLQTMTSNAFIYLWCGKRFPYLERQALDRKVFQRLLPDVRDLFFGRIASYVFNSSDAIIISKFISTITVTFYQNYYLIFHGMMQLFASIFGAMVPYLKRLLVLGSKKEKGKDEWYFRLYTQVSYVLIMFIAVPCAVLIDDFIVMWVGEKFIQSKAITMLMALHMFIDAVQNPAGHFIIANELFKYSKYPEIVGAILNIIISIMLVFKFGLEGVLLGTVISEALQWLLRGTICVKYCFEGNMRGLTRYWGMNFYRLIVCYGVILLCGKVTESINLTSGLGSFLVKGFVIEWICLLGIEMAFFWTREQKKINTLIWGRQWRF